MLGDEAKSEGAADETAIIERMRLGDREAAVAYMWNRRREILALGRKLLHPDDKGVAGPEDLFSTLLRRVDRIVTRGMFTARTSEEADAMVFAVLRRAIANVFRSGRVRRDGQAQFAVSETAPAPLAHIDRGRLRALIAGLDDDAYELLVGKLRGLESEEIAKQLNTSEQAIRQRWRRIRKRLAQELIEEGHGPMSDHLGNRRRSQVSKRGNDQGQAA